MLVWNPEGADERVWAGLRAHFSDEEIIELGQFVQLTYGQQRVIKTWGVGHGEFLADTTGGLAPDRIGVQVAHLPGTEHEIRARVPAADAAYRFTRDSVLRGGIVDSDLKELCFRYLAEDPEVMDFSRFGEREQAALRWAHAIAWDSSAADDELWERLHALFSEQELVELGCAIGFELGQQHWRRTVGLPPRDQAATS